MKLVDSTFAQFSGSFPPSLPTTTTTKTHKTAEAFVLGRTVFLKNYSRYLGRLQLQEQGQVHQGGALPTLAFGEGSCPYVKPACQNKPKLKTANTTHATHPQIDQPSPCVCVSSKHTAGAEKELTRLVSTTRSFVREDEQPRIMMGKPSAHNRKGQEKQTEQSLKAADKLGNQKEVF